MFRESRDRTMDFPRVVPFDTRIRHLQYLEHYAYKCPHCKQETSFTLEEIRRSHGVKESKLATDVQRMFDASYPIRNFMDEFYFDFNCQGCSAPVRIYFEASEKRTSAWEFFGSFVMELRTVWSRFSSTVISPGLDRVAREAEKKLP